MALPPSAPPSLPHFPWSAWPHPLPSAALQTSFTACANRRWPMQLRGGFWGSGLAWRLNDRSPQSRRGAWAHSPGGSAQQPRPLLFGTRGADSQPPPPQSLPLALSMEQADDWPLCTCRVHVSFLSRERPGATALLITPFAPRGKLEGAWGSRVGGGPRLAQGKLWASQGAGGTRGGQRGGASTKECLPPPKITLAAPPPPFIRTRGRMAFFCREGPQEAQW